MLSLTLMDLTGAFQRYLTMYDTSFGGTGSQTAVQYVSPHLRIRHAYDIPRGEAGWFDLRRHLSGLRASKIPLSASSVQMLLLTVVPHL